MIYLETLINHKSRVTLSRNDVNGSTNAYVLMIVYNLSGQLQHVCQRNKALFMANLVQQLAHYIQQENPAVLHSLVSCQQKRPYAQGHASYDKSYQVVA